MAHRITSTDDPDYAQHFGHLGSACDGCGEGIAPQFVEAATQWPPDYMPDGFRKRAAFLLCELCRTESE